MWHPGVPEGVRAWSVEKPIDDEGEDGVCYPGSTLSPRRGGTSGLLTRTNEGGVSNIPSQGTIDYRRELVKFSLKVVRQRRLLL